MFFFLLLLVSLLVFNFFSCYFGKVSVIVGLMMDEVLKLLKLNKAPVGQA